MCSFLNKKLLKIQKFMKYMKAKCMDRILK